MTDIPVFSIIIPTYNRAKIIKRAIDSILLQTFQDFELIVVDDGSCDNTEMVVKEYTDARIIYLYKENGGQNSALNRGLQEAKGKYIAFCDSDDKWLPEKLEKVYKKYNVDDEISVVYHLTGVVDKGKIRLARNDTLEGFIYRDVLTQGYLTSPTFLSCKKECFNKIGLFDLKVVNCQDDDLCFNLCRYYKVGLVKEILGVYYYDLDDRKSNMKKVGADSYLYLCIKHMDEILTVCGKKVMSDKLYEASFKYLIIGEKEMAKQAFNMADEILHNKLIVRKIKWYELGARKCILIFRQSKVYHGLKVIIHRCNNSIVLLIHNICNT